MPRDVLVVAAASFLVAIGLGVIGPVIPLLTAHFGVSAALAGLAISAFAAVRFLSAWRAAAWCGPSASAPS